MHLTHLFYYILVFFFLYAQVVYGDTISDKLDKKELSYLDIDITNNLDKDTQSLLAPYLNKISVISRSSNSNCENKISSLLTSEINKKPRGLHDELYMLLGISYEACGNDDKALQNYNISKDIRSKNPIVAFKIGLLECKKKHLEICKNYLDEADWYGLKEKYAIYHNRAILFALSNKLNDALKEVQQALIVSPKSLESAKLNYYIKIDLMRSLKNKDRVISLQANIDQDLQRIYLLAPNDYSYGVLFAKNLLLTGDSIKGQKKLQKAEEVVNDLIKYNPNQRNELYLIKIQILEKNNKFNELDSFLAEIRNKPKLSPELQAKIATYD